ncbi:MAG TPA: MarR family transcriptional regulator [Gaiellaceae bacterium]|nr:MarR family transcriptional regulator [Gaiellaceae bacterium]
MAKISTGDYVHAAHFRSALRSFHRVAERAAQRAGLTPQRHLLLLMIRGSPDGTGSATVTDLAERLQLAQSTVTELVNRAEDAGLVERRSSPDDGRVVQLQVTADGERRLARIMADLRSEQDDLEAAFEQLPHGGGRITVG